MCPCVCNELGFREGLSGGENKCGLDGGKEDICISACFSSQMRFFTLILKCLPEDAAEAGRARAQRITRVTALVRVGDGGLNAAHGRGLYDVRLLVIAGIEQLFDDYQRERVEVCYLTANACYEPALALQKGRGGGWMEANGWAGGLRV